MLSFYIGRGFVRGDIVYRGFCLEWDLSEGFLSKYVFLKQFFCEGILSRGDFVPRGLCPRGFCLEEYFEGLLSGVDFVRGDSVCIPINTDEWLRLIIFNLVTHRS